MAFKIKNMLSCVINRKAMCTTQEKWKKYFHTQLLEDWNFVYIFPLIFPPQFYCLCLKMESIVDLKPCVLMTLIQSILSITRCLPCLISDISSKALSQDLFGMLLALTVPQSVKRSAPLIPLMMCSHQVNLQPFPLWFSSIK